MGRTICQGSSFSEEVAGGIVKTELCPESPSLDCGQTSALPPRRGVSTILGPSGLGCPAGVPGPQARASAVQLNREGRYCLAPWLVTADDAERKWRVAPAVLVVPSYISAAVFLE